MTQVGDAHHDYVRRSRGVRPPLVDDDSSGDELIEDRGVEAEGQQTAGDTYDIDDEIIFSDWLTSHFEVSERRTSLLFIFLLTRLIILSLLSHFKTSKR